MDNKDLGGADRALVASDQAAARLAPTGGDHGERFTPGPWGVLGAERRKSRRSVPAIFAAGDELKYIAYCDDQIYFYTPTDNVANAHLISAAPDLYEALIAAHDIVQMYGGSDLFERVSMALAKARGEA